MKRDAGGKGGDDEGDDGPQMFMNLGKKEEDKKEQIEEEEEEDSGVVKLKPLFRFECDITDQRYVSCMDWNQANPDLLAVSYGEPEPDS